LWFTKSRRALTSISAPSSSANGRFERRRQLLRRQGGFGSKGDLLASIGNGFGYLVAITAGTYASRFPHTVKGSG
jgi:hypothetical protein